jgi:hypothetical protein
LEPLSRVFPTFYILAPTAPEHTTMAGARITHESLDDGWYTCVDDARREVYFWLQNNPHSAFEASCVVVFPPTGNRAAHVQRATIYKTSRQNGVDNDYLRSQEGGVHERAVQAIESLAVPVQGEAPNKFSRWNTSTVEYVAVTVPYARNMQVFALPWHKSTIPPSFQTAIDAFEQRESAEEEAELAELRL